MGILFTESFQRFATMYFGNLATSTQRPIQTDSDWTEKAFQGTTQYVVNGPLATGNDTGSVPVLMGLVQDPIITSKKRLALDGTNPPLAKSSAGYGLMRTFATARTKYMLGFLVRFREGDWLKQNPTSNVNFAYGFELVTNDAVKVTPANGNFRYASVVGVNGTTYAPKSIFAMGTTGVATTWWSSDTVQNQHNNPPDIRMQGARDPNSSGMTLAWDTDYFCEVEVDITNKTIKCWIDDVYIGLSTWNATYHPALANGFTLNLFRGGSTSTANDIGGVMLSDIYCLDMSDNVAPNVRLGKTTRVLGENPDTDVDVQFTRPDGFASNADVINDPIDSNVSPTTYLAAEGAGKRDIYSKSNSSISQFAGTVYGVTVRARYQNASSSAHELGVIADDGTTQSTLSLGSSPAGQPPVMKQVAFNLDPSGRTWTVARAAALKIGFKIIS